jgi:hypothetical protein
MQKLPNVVTSSVIRSSQQGESHGGVYLVDFEAGNFEQVIDWNDPSISWEGRGGDRGLRGIAFYQGKVYIAASDEVFVYNRKFELIESHRNKYLKHCHEICIAGDTLYLTSTGLNSILEFDLTRNRFTHGHTIVYPKRKGLLRQLTRIFSHNIRVVTFDANGAAGPPMEFAGNDLHINSVARQGDAITIGGTKIDALLLLHAGTLREYAPLPVGTHNAMTYKDGIIYNDTRADRVVIASRDNRIARSFAVPEFPELPRSTPGDHARQRFGRGLCTFGDELIIAGSSPSTVSVYHCESGERVRMINLSRDIRNSIHGLELWPE